MIEIAVINESTVISDTQVQAMIPAFQTQWNRDLSAIWNLDQATFTFTPKDQQPPAASWWVVFLDDSDQAGALAYHDLTDSGLPISKVFVKTIQTDNTSVSVGATHEICEMAVDPTINLAAQDTTGAFWAYEVCDPVEDDKYGYAIGDTLVTDFVTPAWFGFKNASGAIDFQKHATQAFVVLSGGYAQKFQQNGWQQVNGTDAAHTAKRHVKEAAPGTRRARRKTPLGQRQRSDSMAKRHAGHH